MNSYDNVVVSTDIKSVASYTVQNVMAKNSLDMYYVVAFVDI